VEAILAALGVVYAADRLLTLFGPAPGPRVLPGELRGREATGRAAKAYWEAENAASKGLCSVARYHFETGERYRHMAEDRAARGDHTAGDVRASQRIARAELKSCKPLNKSLEAAPLMSLAQSRKRVRQLRRRGCKVSAVGAPGATVIFADCPEDR
jgi:hypothetical protein